MLLTNLSPLPPSLGKGRGHSLEERASPSLVTLPHFPLARLLNDLVVEGVYQPQPLNPPLFTKERGRLFLKGRSPFRFPLLNNLLAKVEIGECDLYNRSDESKRAGGVWPH